MVRCFGLIRASIKDNGQREFSTAMERCTSQMELLKLESSRIMFSRAVRTNIKSHPLQISLEKNQDNPQFRNEFRVQPQSIPELAK